MLKIYCTRLRECLDKERYVTYLNSLPIDIKDKVKKFRRWQDGHACLFGKMLLMRGVADFGYNISLDGLKYSAYNRPYLSSEFDFNISHAGEYVVCAISDSCKLGIDIEEIKPMKVNDFVSQWTPEELKHLKGSLNPDFSFYNFWTRKEAVVKANGQGLNIPLNEINILNNKVSCKRETWFLKNIFIAERYFCHIATDREINEPVVVLNVCFY